MNRRVSDIVLRVPMKKEQEKCVKMRIRAKVKEMLTVCGYQVSNHVHVSTTPKTRSQNMI